MFKVFLQIIKMPVIVQVKTIIFIVQKCILVSLLRKSAFKLVVIGSITNIHIKNSIGVKTVQMIEPYRNNTSRKQHFDKKISPSAHPHFCREKKNKKRKNKKEIKTKQ